MKKVIYYFGIMALITGLVGDAGATARRFANKVGGLEERELVTTPVYGSDGKLYMRDSTGRLRQTQVNSETSKTTNTGASHTPTPRTGKTQGYTTRSSISVRPSSYMASSSQVSNQSKSEITIPRKVPEAPSPSRSAFQELQDIQQKQIESLERKLEHLSNEQQALIK